MRVTPQLNLRVLAMLAATLLLMGGGTNALAQPVPGRESPDEVCKQCHADQVESYAATKHGTKADGRTPANNGGCLVCHGANALEHAKQGGGRGVGGIVDPASKTMAASAKNGICLSCHEGGQRMHWSQSLHASRDTSCTSCHKLHEKDKVRDKATQAQVCFTCHKEQRAQINRPYRHAIEEGKVVCSDCHNAHGSVGPKNMKRDSIVETCYQCHLDKRGPFVRSHQPATEDCSICHNPHGTTYPNLLKVRVPFLCQSCHEMASHRRSPGLLDQSGRSANFEARGCLNCHTQIHGSNYPNESAGRGYRR